MGLADDLSSLGELHAKGVLSDDEFQRAKARLLGGSAAAGDRAAVDALNQLRRSRSDRWIGGVCGGIAAITGIESWVWRLIVVAMALVAGSGVLLYLLLWIFVPED